jgi:hypothetical protein
VANAKPGFVDLTPVSTEPAADIHAAWAATLLGLEPPLIWERTHHDGEEDDDCRF